MMMADDLRDLGVVFDLRENPLANRGMLLHLAPFLQSERPWLLQETCREADLPDVVDQTRKGEQAV